MHALLENGPLANQQIETADTPPQVLQRETRFATHVYDLIGIEQVQSQGGVESIAVYGYAGELPRAA